ncbi:hypothetical protein NESM_000125400 [Novymonas esmeraldas]|uniref:Uncharacterized protein n=1 Tax=Novymonas esmeraldas TaxID=1808958 RepID=A0AAW0F368_9TRYP
MDVQPAATGGSPSPTPLAAAPAASAEQESAALPPLGSDTMEKHQEEQQQQQQQQSDDAATASTEAQLHAMEAKMVKWKEVVTTQLNDAARKNKKLREELRLLREEKEAALSELRVQLSVEHQERTAMQSDEVAALTQQNAALREEKRIMAATHETELQTTRLKLRDVIQLELETTFKRREEQWTKEKAQLQARAEAQETERAQAEHECDVLKMRLSRLGAQYDELATLLQPEGGAPTSARALETGDDGGSSGGGVNGGGGGSSGAARQQSAVTAAHARQIESIKAELQSKEQHTQFLLDRARQEHEAEKTQLVRELQLREEELKVAHTLLKQVQMESSRAVERVSRAQTERQALEQRYAEKVAALSQELAGRIHAVDEAVTMNKRLQEQLRTTQQQVTMLEDESTMREEAFHSLMLSEDNKRLVMELQRAVQTARDEAQEWRMQYYSSLTGTHASAKDAAPAASPPSPRQSLEPDQDGAGGESSPAGEVRTPQAWQDQLTARAAQLEAHAAQLARKAALLDTAEAKLQEMRRSMASQASLLLQQQQQQQQQQRGGAVRGGGNGGGRRGGRPHDDNAAAGVFVDGGDDTGGVDSEDNERDLADTSPFISIAASVLPSTLHGSLRALEAQRRRLNLPGSCGLCVSCFSGGGTTTTTGTPRRLRRQPLLLIVTAAALVIMLLSFRAMV